MIVVDGSTESSSSERETWVGNTPGSGRQEIAVGRYPVSGMRSANKTMRIRWGQTVVDRRTQEEEGSNRKKDPDDWTTGEEPMTGAQRSYMHTLAEEAQEEVSDDLTKAEASKKIDELQEKTGRKPPRADNL